MRFLNVILAGLPVLSFIGCTCPCHVVPLDLPDCALENAVDTAQNESLVEYGSQIPREWWLLFNDAQLNECIEKTLVRNPSLQAAQAQILASCYNAAKVRSELYPYVFLGADVSRQKLSKTGVIPFNSGPTGSNTPVIDVPTVPGSKSMIPEYFTLYETELNLRYSFDFWGKHKNAFCAALGMVQAKIAEEAFTRLALSIAVASVYYELQVNYKRRDTMIAFVKNRISYTELVQKRVKANLDNELSLQLAEANLADAKDILLQIEGDIAVNQYQLMAFMAGNFDEEFAQVNLTVQPLPKVPVPENLPLHLIAQRPDINSQLWLIQSAGKQIQVAKAEFYPDFNLAAFFGYQTIHFAKLFQPASTFFNIDPAMTLPIFEGGKLIANLRGSEINYDLAILEYNDLIINAAKEVLNAIAILRNSVQREKEIELKLELQSELSRLTSLRVSHSLNSSLDELVSIGNTILAEHQEAIALGRSIQATLELIKSLGGGYGSCDG